MFTYRVKGTDASEELDYQVHEVILTDRVKWAVAAGEI
jgi:hypothetical protein